MVYISSSSESVLVSGSVIKIVLKVLTCGQPCSFFRRVLLYLIGRWGYSLQSLAVDTVDWSLVLLSDSESELFVLWNVSEEAGLDMLDSLDESDAGSGGISGSPCDVAYKVPFIATRCVSNWSMLGSVGENGPEMGLEWV